MGIEERRERQRKLPNKHKRIKERQAKERGRRRGTKREKEERAAGGRQREEGAPGRVRAAGGGEKDHRLLFLFLYTAYTLLSAARNVPSPSYIPRG